MARFAFEDLWCYVVRSSANRALLLTIEVELGCEAEVAQLNLHLVIDKKISELQVAMNYSVSVEILQSIDDLHRVRLYFQLMKALPSAQKFVEALILADLKQDIYVFAVLEEVLELDDVLVLDGPVNFNLTHQLLFGT